METVIGHPRVRRRLLAPLILAGLALSLCAGPAAARPRQVPFGFLGVMADGVLLNPKVSLDSEMTQMVRTGVESVRVAVYWSTTQPYASAAQVPAGRPRSTRW